MVQYRVLGEVEVVAAGQSVALGGDNQRRLLSVLLARAGEPTSSDALAASLWPHAPPGSTRGRVQTVVSRVRRALGDDRGDLVTTADGYRLDAGADALDAGRFEALVAGAARAADPEALELLEQALALWRGPAFGALGDLEEVRLAAIRLDELRLAAVEERMELLVRLGRSAAALPELEALVAAQPLRERLRGQLMRALHATGRQADALQSFRAYSELLGEHLGLEPSAGLVALHDTILRDEQPTRVVQPPTGPELTLVAAVADDEEPARLEQRGWDALWARDHAASVEARQQAYVRLLRSGRPAGAGRVAIWLGVNAAIRLKNAVAFDWSAAQSGSCTASQRALHTASSPGSEPWSPSSRGSSTSLLNARGAPRPSARRAAISTSRLSAGSWRAGRRCVQGRTGPVSR